MCILCSEEETKVIIVSELHIDCSMLKEFPKVDAKKLITLCLRCPNLRSLDNLPESLTSLWISADMASLPPLPKNLQFLTLFQCPRLCTITELPGKLKDLMISKCPLLVTFPVFPVSLERLSIEDSPLVGLEALPQSKALEAESRRQSLKVLRLKDCPNLSFLPSLPTTLLSLTCIDCPSLKNLPPLPAYSKHIPSNLKELVCMRCGLERLPNLPEGLHFLLVISCPILTLPALPKSLQILDVTDCPTLQHISELSRDLSSLSLERLQITSLPAFPEDLLTLRIKECPNLKQIPDLPGRVYLKEFSCVKA